jgi:hypothetical protein
VVFIVCEGNEFQGTLDKVWKLNEILMKEPAKVHQDRLNVTYVANTVTNLE